MRHSIIKYLTVLIFMILSPILLAQNKAKTNGPNYPKTFTIDAKELDQLFSSKENDVVRFKTNTYLNNSKVILNSSFKENKQLKLKLNYFKNAELYVQINGKDSKIIYILSSDDSIFYNSTIDQGKITFTQCKKDDIVSE